MATSSDNVVTDEKTRTVTIRQAEYSLQQGAFSKGYHHIIYASTVHVRKGFVNPGCDLTLYAAQVLVDQGGGAIDVSGSDGTGYPSGNRRDAVSTKQGTYNGDDGGDGAAAEAGRPGGAVSIYAGRIQGGTLEIKSRGGVGGRGQDGGNGKGGAQPTERGKPATPQLVQVGTEVVMVFNRPVNKAVMGWGSDVDKIGEDGMKAVLLVAHQAQSGAEGGHGGNAGLAGRPGDGGGGGRTMLRWLATPTIAVDKDLAGGAPGATAVHGRPGGGATGGLGGKYLYKTGLVGTSIDWSAFDENSDWDTHWNTANSKTFAFFKVDHFADLGVKNDYIVRDGENKKLKLRAASGPNGRDGGYGPRGEAKAPAIPTGNRGADGSFISEKADMSGRTFETVPLPYLLMLQRTAAIAALNRDDEEAADILRWMLLLTASFKSADLNANNDAGNRRRIHDEAESALLMLRRNRGAERIDRCVYKDIERYADFVETSLVHVGRQEEYVREYNAAQAKIAERKNVLDDAIAEAQDHIGHLTGTTLAPGSILYSQEKEKQLKSAIGELDVQLLDYKYRLENMPQVLKEEINAKVREKSKITMWDALELIGMAAGVVINFASAAGSLATMVGKVKDFYKESLELVSWGEILIDGLWNREFGSIKADLKALLDTEEWKGLTKDGKAFVESTTDFWGKIQAYEELSKAKLPKTFKLDPLDIQASVLIFDTAKLQLKKKRNEFEFFIFGFIEEHEQARVWKRVFSDYFDTSETRFDLLAHLADVQAERRELEYQRGLTERNLELLKAQRQKLDFDPNAFQAEDVRSAMEANLSMALEQGLARIMDEDRAFKIWTLQEHALPKIPKNLTSEILRTRFHQPVWTRIKEQLSSGAPPARRDSSDTPFVWTREQYPKQFEALEKTGKMMLSLPLPDGKGSNIYFERLIDVKVYLRGATAQAGSPFYCVLRHPGTSDFLNRERKSVTCYQEPRGIEMSYVLEGAKPNYHYDGAIEQQFDIDNDLARIRYSPYTTWELQVIRDYRQNAREKVYNQGIDLTKLEAVELRPSIFFSSFHVRMKGAPNVEAASGVA